MISNCGRLILLLTFEVGLLLVAAKPPPQASKHDDINLLSFSERNSIVALKKPDDFMWSISAETPKCESDCQSEESIRSKRRSDPDPATLKCQEIRLNPNKSSDICFRPISFRREDIMTTNYDIMFATVYSKESENYTVPFEIFPKLEFVRGFVKGETYSAIDGFTIDNKFYGNIYLNDHVYYVDPHHLLKKQIVTRQQADNLDPKDPANKWTKAFSQKRFPNLTEMYHRSNAKNGSRMDDDESITKRVCDVAIVVDPSFFKEIGRSSIEKTLLQVMWVFKEANEMFQSQDFNDDGKSDMLGIRIAAITIIKDNRSDVNILKRDVSNPEDFLKMFSRYNFEGYCLGILFTNRMFHDLVLGLSWRGNPIPGGVGGICQKLATYKGDGKTYSFNSMFVSMRSKQKPRIPLRMAVLNLVHELMHSFGAKHDPVSNASNCSPHGDNYVRGRYLMSRYSNNGRKVNHEILSPCTKSAVTRTLGAKHRTLCLREIKVDAHCGDGMIQSGEECDCGSVRQCLRSRSNCIPLSGIFKDNAGCIKKSNHFNVSGIFSE